MISARSGGDCNSRITHYQTFKMEDNLQTTSMTRKAVSTYMTSTE